MAEIEVCPECGNDDFDTLDKVDYEVYVLNCRNCGWTGDSDQLVKKNPQPKGDGE